MKKLAVILSALVASWIVSFFGIIFCGNAVGHFFNSEHVHEQNPFACQCDEAPILTEWQAIIVGIAVFVLVNIGVYMFLRRFNLTTKELIIVLFLTMLTNYKICAVTTELMHTRVSG